jgi:hypothetical protein
MEIKNPISHNRLRPNGPQKSEVTKKLGLRIMVNKLIKVKKSKKLIILKLYNAINLYQIQSKTNSVINKTNSLIKLKIKLELTEN